MRRLLIALALLASAAFPVAAQTVCVTLSADGSSVIGIVPCVNTAQIPEPPSYAALSATDPRVTAFQNASGAPAALAQHIAQGITITSTSAPAVDGTYAMDDTARANITAIASAINAGMGFPQEVSTYQYPDASGVPHGFPSTAAFLSFAKAARDLYDAEAKAAQAQGAGQTPSWPSTTVTIP